MPITAETRLLFEQGQDPTASCPVCSKSGTTAIAVRVSIAAIIARSDNCVVCFLVHCVVYEGITGANDTRYLLQEIRDEVAQINDILQCCAPAVCAASNGNGTCNLFGVPTRWNGAFYEPWVDTMSTANYFSEFWLLQSLNNMTLPNGLSFETILKLSRVHKVRSLS